MSSPDRDTSAPAGEEPVPRGGPTFDPTVLAELRAALEDDEFVFDLVRTFLAEAPRHIAALTTAAEAGDLEAVVATAHRLKGSALTFGASGLVNVCGALEGSPTECGRLVPGVARELDDASDHLNRYVREARSGHGARPVPTQERTSRRILVVDDDALIQAVARMGLEAAGGWDVATASNGAEAVDLVLSDQPDVILMDVMMPIMDGPTACRALSEIGATARIPIILLTAKHDLEAQRLVPAQVAGVLAKPFDPAGLSDAIEALLCTSDHS